MLRAMFEYHSSGLTVYTSKLSSSGCTLDNKTFQFVESLFLFFFFFFTIRARQNTAWLAWGRGGGGGEYSQKC